MNNLKKYYLNTKGFFENTKEHLVLVLTDDERYSQIFASKEIDFILTYLKNIKFIKSLKEIYISGFVFENDKDRIKNSINVKVHFEENGIFTQQDSDEKNYSSRNDSLVNDLALILNKNECFLDFFKEKMEFVDRAAVKELLFTNIMSTYDSGLDFTKYGKLLFEENCDYDRKVYISNYTVNNKIKYSNDCMFEGPLFNLYKKVSNYLDSVIPKFQERSNIQSTVYSALNMEFITQIVLYVLSHNNYDDYENINFDLNPISFSATFAYDETNILSNIFKKFLGMIEFKEYISSFPSEKYIVTIQNRNHFQTIKVLYSQSLSKYDPDLSTIDYQIIDFIRKNGKVSRSMIDNEFSISSRNSSYRLKKLLEKGIIKIEGRSKAILYSLNNIE